MVSCFFAKNTMVRMVTYCMYEREVYYEHNNLYYSNGMFNDDMYNRYMLDRHVHES